MRRVSCLVASSFAARSIATAAFTNAEVAKAEGVTEEALKALNPRTATWIGLDVVARQKLAKFSATVSPAENYVLAYNKALSDAPKAVPEGAKAALAAAGDLPALFKAYAAIIGPAYALKAKLDAEKLEAAYLTDRLKIGLSHFKQAQLDTARKQLTALETDIAKIEKELAAMGAEFFSTDLFNTIANVVRIAGYPQISTRILDDMTLLKVPFNTATKILLNNACFGDGPLEDSGMLFAFVEYPERGEIFATASTDLDAIATETMKIMGDRHQTPVDGGRKLQKPDTHPCLQRSPE